MSATDLREDVERTGRLIEEIREQLPRPGKASLFQNMNPDVKAYVEGKHSG